MPRLDIEGQDPVCSAVVLLLDYAAPFVVRFSILFHIEGSGDPATSGRVG
jgi:hypothetical protein